MLQITQIIRIYSLVMAIFLSPVVPAQTRRQSSKPSQSHLAAAPARSIYLGDNSDWWSMLRSEDGGKQIPGQKREPSPANLRILGIDLKQDRPLAQAIAKLGPATPVERGDASTGRTQLCYVSEANASNVHLIFEEGEVEGSFYLFEDGAHWKGESRCEPSKLVSVNLWTEAGLGLRETPSQVESLLGEPSLRRADRLTYVFSLLKKRLLRGICG
jgi:hypothetical protein